MTIEFNKIPLCITTVALCAIIMLLGCSNKADYPKEMVLNFYETPSLPSSLTPSKMQIKDTINNISASIVTATYIRKNHTDNYIDMKPVNEFWQKDLTEFTEKISKDTSKSIKGASHYEIRLISYAQKNNVNSVLFAKKTYIPSKDTITKFLTHNFKDHSQNELSFLDIYHIDENNIKQFNDIFHSSYTVNDLSKVKFCFDKRFLWLLQVDRRIGVKEDRMEKFLIND